MHGAAMKISPWTLLIVGIILVLSHLYAYESGNTNGANAVKVKEQGREIARQSGVIENIEKDLAQADSERKRLADAAKQSEKDHANEIKDVRNFERAAATKRVRIDKNLFCGTTSGDAEGTTPVSDGQADAGTAFLPEPFATNLRQLTAQADEVSADLRSIKRQADEAQCFQ